MGNILSLYVFASPKYSSRVVSNLPWRGDSSSPIALTSCAKDSYAVFAFFRTISDASNTLCAPVTSSKNSSASAPRALRVSFMPRLILAVRALERTFDGSEPVNAEFTVPDSTPATVVARKSPRLVKVPSASRVKIFSLFWIRDLVSPEVIAALNICAATTSSLSSPVSM